MQIPDWIIEGLEGREKSKSLLKFLKEKGVETICEQAQCPNIGTCFSNKVATFLLMGSVCTRNCTFCAVSGGKPLPVDKDEPEKIALTVKELGIEHAVITSVTRDDLEDGGANHFAEVVRKVREINEEVTVELLIPDFKGDNDSLSIVLEEEPEVLNHNIETIKDLYREVRPLADYNRSLHLLSRAKGSSNTIFTKSGMMVGLGETEEQVYEAMDDLLDAGVQMLTIGQYLRPTRRHHEVKRYVHPQEFARYGEVALDKGFLAVASGPFVRSSYVAKELYEEVKRKRDELL
jgi:lipoic acid synthetase